MLGSGSSGASGDALSAVEFNGYLNLTDGRMLAWVVNLRTGAANAFYFAEHSINSANIVLTICGSLLSDPTRPAELGTPLLVDARAFTFDNYFTGTEKRYIDGMTFAIGAEKYVFRAGACLREAVARWVCYTFVSRLVRMQPVIVSANTIT